MDYRKQMMITFTKSEIVDRKFSMKIDFLQFNFKGSKKEKKNLECIYHIIIASCSGFREKPPERKIIKKILPNPQGENCVERLLLRWEKMHLTITMTIYVNLGSFAQVLQ